MHNEMVKRQKSQTPSDLWWSGHGFDCWQLCQHLWQLSSLWEEGFGR